MTISTICEKIRLYRNNKGLTQKAVAKALFMDERNYAKFERGQKKSMDIVLLLSLSDILEINILDLISTQKERNIKEGDLILPNEIYPSAEEFKKTVSQLQDMFEILLEEQKCLRKVILDLQLELKSINRDVF